jgi:hypothetical protein
VSITVTLKAWRAEFPAASLAVQVTVLVPSGKILPEAGLHSKVARLTSSVADAL